MPPLSECGDNAGMIALVALVLLCLLGPIVVGVLSALVAVAPYLLAVLLLMGVIAFFCK